MFFQILLIYSLFLCSFFLHFFIFSYFFHINFVLYNNKYLCCLPTFTMVSYIQNIDETLKETTNEKYWNS